MSQRTLSIIWMAFVIIFLIICGVWLVGYTTRSQTENVVSERSAVYTGQDSDTNSKKKTITGSNDTESVNAADEADEKTYLTVEDILPDVTSPIAQAALSQVGYIPEVENVTTYHDDLGLEYGSDWCGWFVWWCLIQADREDLLVEGPGWAAHWSEKGKVHKPNDGYTPQPGDIVTFDRDENGNVDHVGIVVAYEDGILYTVEGNTVMQGTEEGETPYGVYARYYDSTGWMFVRESSDNQKGEEREKT